MMLHQAGQPDQHTTNELFRPLVMSLKTSNSNIKDCASVYTNITYVSDYACSL